MSFRITFLRHGKADKTLSDHRLHPLSEEGANQARRRREMLNGPKYDLILHSPLRRTKETALIVAGVDETAETFMVPALYLEESDPRIASLNKVFDELGHAPLEQYEDRVKNDLDSLAREMKDGVWQRIVEVFCCGDRIKNVLVVGHAILLPSLCQAFTGRVAPFTIDVLGECEGYELEVTDMKRADLIRSLK